MELSRRDLLVSLLQALFLALFPWLRSERGALVVKAAAEHMVAKDAVAVERAIFKTGDFRLSMGLRGYEVSPEQFDALTRATPEWDAMLAAARTAREDGELDEVES